MQQLANHGIKTELVSVDLNNGPYDTLKGLIYTNRLDYYKYSVFIRELEELKLIGGKIDHPEISKRRGWEEEGDERGSKDVSDAVAGVVATLISRPTRGKIGFMPLVGGDEFVAENFKEEKYESTSGWDPDQKNYGSGYEIDDEEDD
jgi:hypothetical protein